MCLWSNLFKPTSELVPLLTSWVALGRLASTCGSRVAGLPCRVGNTVHQHPLGTSRNNALCFPEVPALHVGDSPALPKSQGLAMSGLTEWAMVHHLSLIRIQPILPDFESSFSFSKIILQTNLHLCLEPRLQTKDNLHWQNAGFYETLKHLYYYSVGIRT